MKKTFSYWFFAFTLAAASALVFLTARLTDTLMIPDYVNYTRCFILALPGLALLVAAWIGTAIRQPRVPRQEPDDQINLKSGQMNSEGEERFVTDRHD